MGIISIMAIEYDMDCCLYLIDWETALDTVNWSELLEIASNIGMDRTHRRLIRNLDVNQVV